MVGGEVGEDATRRKTQMLGGEQGPRRTQEVSRYGEAKGRYPACRESMVSCGIVSSILASWPSVAVP